MTWLRKGKNWHSMNTVEMVRAQQVTEKLRAERPKPLHELYPDSENLAILLISPLSKKELRKFYFRNLRYKGNNKIHRL